jgi:hypothetical protein
LFFSALRLWRGWLCTTIDLGDIRMSSASGRVAGSNIDLPPATVEVSVGGGQPAANVAQVRGTLGTVQ